MPGQPSREREIELSDFDPFGLELRADPFSLIPKLLESSPGFMLAEGTPSAYVARHEHVTAVTRNFKRFSSVKPKGLPGMERFDMFNGQPVMNYSDPPDHTRRRKVVNASFTPKRIERLHDGARETIAGLLDSLESGQEVEMLQEVCRPLSTEVLLGGLMNVAPEDRYIFFNTIKGMGLLDKVAPGEGKPQRYLEAWEAGSEYCRKAIDRAQTEGSEENLIGLIADASREGGSINDDEMMAMMMVLLTGGMTTVASAAATVLLCLADKPDQKLRIRDDPELAATALEEALRLYPPVTLSMRFAVEDVEIDGKTIPAGMPVYCLWTAANHDPAVFPNPYQFDIDRPNLKDHVAFGHGIHTCIGNSITRSVVPMLVNAVLERFPDFVRVKPDDPPDFDTGSARGRHLEKLLLKL